MDYIMAMYVFPHADTFGPEVVSFYREVAGERFTWEGITGGSEMSAKFKRLIRRDLAERQGWVCPACGEPFTEADLDGLVVEANHIVSQGGVKRGWLPGNVFTGHGMCNKRTAATYDDAGNVIAGKAILDMSDIVRPDLIAMAWTPMPTLKRAAGYLK